MSPLRHSVRFFISLFPFAFLVSHRFPLSFPSLNDPAVESFYGNRYDNTSVILQWNPTEGITEYLVRYGVVNDTMNSSMSFPAPATSLVVPNLTPGMIYWFSINVGNAFGIDGFNGPTTDATTSSKFACFFGLIVFCRNGEQFAFLASRLLQPGHFGTCHLAKNDAWIERWFVINLQSLAFCVLDPCFAVVVVVVFFLSDGICQAGYGGKPTSNCAPLPSGSHAGSFGSISEPCIKSMSSKNRPISFSIEVLIFFHINSPQTPLLSPGGGGVFDNSRDFVVPSSGLSIVQRLSRPERGREPSQQRSGDGLDRPKHRPPLGIPPCQSPLSTPPSLVNPLF